MRPSAAVPALAVVALPLLVAALGACNRTTLRIGSGGGDVPEDVIAMQREPRDTPREPRVSAVGSDLSDLPQIYPDGDWLPIEAPLLSMSVLVKVKVNGEIAVATLDSGAMGTTMSTPMAEQLGILGDDTPRGKPIRAIDAHGSVITGEKLSLGDVSIGRHHWTDVDVTVLGDTPDLFLVGADVLQDVDLYLAADEGIVGVFDAGRGPTSPDDLVVRLDRSDRQLTVTAAAQGSRGEVTFPLIVDTGAWNTSVPLLVGINNGLPADVGYESTTLAVGGEQTNRGRFVLSPMRLGPDRVPVGKVLAIGSTMDNGGRGLGLLGNDVMMRHHSLLSFKRGELRLQPLKARPAVRTRGPGGARCAGACVAVDIVDRPAARYDDADLPGVCLQIDVDKAYANKTIELAITGAADDLFNGGAIRAFLTANDDGATACFHLWRQLENLGVTADTPLSLRWLRTENVQWPCDPMKTRCITFTGPLAKLPVK